MIKESSPSSIDKLAGIILQMIQKCRKKPTADNFKELLTVCTQLVTLIRKYVTYSKKTLDKDFDIDVAFEFVGIVLSGRVVENPVFKIKALIDYRLNRYNRIASYDKPGMKLIKDFTSGDYTVNRLLMNEIIADELADMPEHLAIQILYFVQTPERIPPFVEHSADSVSKHVVLLKVFAIQKKIMKEVAQNVDITLSQNRVTNLLLLSGLYNDYPAMFVLLSQFKDFRTFIQFVTLFEGQDIKIPRISELNDLFAQSSAVAKNFDQGTLSIRNRELLANLITNCKLEDIGPDTHMNAYLEEYISSLVQVSVENYSKLQEKLIAQLDRNDPKKVLDTYKILNSELSSQQKLIQEMVTTLGTIKDIRSALEIISKPSDPLPKISPSDAIF